MSKASRQKITATKKNLPSTPGCGSPYLGGLKTGRARTGCERGSIKMKKAKPATYHLPHMPLLLSVPVPVALSAVAPIPPPAAPPPRQRPRANPLKPCRNLVQEAQYSRPSATEVAVKTSTVEEQLCEIWIEKEKQKKKSHQLKASPPFQSCQRPHS